MQISKAPTQINNLLELEEVGSKKNANALLSINYDGSVRTNSNNRTTTIGDNT
jgi:hypothetical protein